MLENKIGLSRTTSPVLNLTCFEALQWNSRSWSREHKQKLIQKGDAVRTSGTATCQVRAPPTRCQSHSCQLRQHAGDTRLIWCVAVTAWNDLPSEWHCGAFSTYCLAPPRLHYLIQEFCVPGKQNHNGVAGPNENLQLNLKTPDMKSQTFWCRKLRAQS